ncbi:MAG: hypothetical protein IK051_10460, partial [Rhodocyclaceae bacterium]|nr:hypothetical protein [Rhodocyclaceae bacterium]
LDFGAGRGQDGFGRLSVAAFIVRSVSDVSEGNRLFSSILPKTAPPSGAFFVLQIRLDCAPNNPERLS